MKSSLKENIILRNGLVFSIALLKERELKNWELEVDINGVVCKRCSVPSEESDFVERPHSHRS